MTLPVRGAPGSGLWGDTIDADLQLLDAHDHTTGKGLPITTAAISINADLPFSSLWAPTQLHRVQFSNIAAGALTAGQRKSLYASDGTSGGVANELYWINNAGNKVQITSGNTLNFAAFVGGIGGDYTSVGAQLNFSDSQKAYEFKEGTADTNGWSRLRSGDLRLFPFNTTAISAYVGQAAPVGIVSPYTVTWPLALPGSTVLQQIDNTGQAIFSNTVPNAVTFSALITASAGLTAAANQHITVAGTGEYKHAGQTLSFTGTDFIVQSGTATYTTSGGISSTASCVLVAGIPLKVGDRITSITLTFDSVTGTVDVTDFHVDKVTANGTATSLGVTTVNNIGTPTTTTIDLTDTTLAVNESFIVSIAINATGCTVRNVNVTYTHP